MRRQKPSTKPNAKQFSVLRQIAQHGGRVLVTFQPNRKFYTSADGAVSFPSNVIDALIKKGTLIASGATLTFVSRGGSFR
jgi:hypothetical protein